MIVMPTSVTREFHSHLPLPMNLICSNHPLLPRISFWSGLGPIVIRRAGFVDVEIYEPISRAVLCSSYVSASTGTETLLPHSRHEAS